jgi:hypothetical protein
MTDSGKSGIQKLTLGVKLGNLRDFGPSRSLGWRPRYDIKSPLTTAPLRVDIHLSLGDLGQLLIRVALFI